MKGVKSEPRTQRRLVSSKMKLKLFRYHEIISKFCFINEYSCYLEINKLNGSVFT